jgi:RNA polymerase sigma-70 factor (ECF subfamily)
MNAIANHHQPNAHHPACEELVTRAQQGDLDAFEELVKRHQDRVYNTALRLTTDPEDAADAAQETFLRCFRKLHTFRGDCKFTSWIYRVTVNVVKDHWRRQQQRRVNQTFSLNAELGPERLALIEQIPSTRPGPRQIAQGQESYDLMLARLKELRPDFREILELRFADELSYNEIAETLDCTLDTVKTRLFRARRQLREEYEALHAEPLAKAG